MSQRCDSYASQPQRERLFVALEIPTDVKTRLSGLQSCFPGLKWTPASNLHLTLRFIGSVPQAHVEQIQQSLRFVTCASFRLIAAGLGLFQRKAGGILWAGVNKEPALLQLKRQVDETLCVSAGLHLKDESFSPHLTLSRLKSPVSPALKAQVQERTAVRLGEFTVTGFTLFRSFLQPAGAIHESVERYSLGMAL
ncbi:MAG: RNA 2',3'-cyclic phosphodiesterase [Deltaproteobacteria bacterium]|jgi:2'-5' RNA ligase|nr:RNA 2',3'-cyclic phosphodiesterase [Deltaproteobacteria bacterium]